MNFHIILANLLTNLEKYFIINITKKRIRKLQTKRKDSNHYVPYRH